MGSEITPVDKAYEDEEVGLPADTLAILNQFLQDKEVRASLKSSQLGDFEENWVT